MSDANRLENILRARELWRGRNSRKLATIQDNLYTRSLRTSQEQLDTLDARLGVGMGARKERRRLLKKILA